MTTREQKEERISKEMGTQRPYEYRDDDANLYFGIRYNATLEDILARADKQNNRNYIGTEISQEYVDIANKRLSNTIISLF